MAKVKANSSSNSARSVRPALTPEAEENQMIALAMDLVKQRLLDGTATSQETTHFLKLATTKHKLEQERLALENELTKAKTKALGDAEDIKEMYTQALMAMRNYSGQGEPDEYQNIFRIN